MRVNPENVLLDSACPCCEHTAVLELRVMPEMYDPQQLMVVVKCHFCETAFNDLVRINEMEACDDL